ncbi:hypothetical protein [Nocardia sp. NPDC058480]|uniref:hypothetical protein n=1 Tax=unclassified Nocardia TaxID=2637762 RepID=UPI00364868FC
MTGEQFNFKPSFEQVTVPCEGEVGDLLILTPLKHGEFDSSKVGKASVWFCTKAASSDGPATWQQVEFTGFATCNMPVVQIPPQDVPPLGRH